MTLHVKSLNLEGLTVLQRKLLIDYVRRSRSQLWSRILRSYSWNRVRESLEEFLRLKGSEFLKRAEGGVFA